MNEVLNNFIQSIQEENTLALNDNIWLIVRNVKSIFLTSQVKKWKESGKFYNTIDPVLKYLLIGDDFFSKNRFLKELVFGYNEIVSIFGQSEQVKKFDILFQIWNLMTFKITLGVHDGQSTSLFTKDSFDIIFEFEKSSSSDKVYQSHLYLLGYPEVDCFDSVNQKYIYKAFLHMDLLKSLLSETAFQKDQIDFIISTLNIIEKLMNLSINTNSWKEFDGDEIKEIEIHFKINNLNDILSSSTSLIESFSLKEIFCCEIYHQLLLYLNQLINLNLQKDIPTDEKTVIISLFFINSLETEDGKNDFQEIWKEKSKFWALEKFHRFYNYTFTMKEPQCDILNEKLLCHQHNITLLNNPYKTKDEIMQEEEQVSFVEKEQKRKEKDKKKKDQDYDSPYKDYISSERKYEDTYKPTLQKEKKSKEKIEKFEKVKNTKGEKTLKVYERREEDHVSKTPRKEKKSKEKIKKIKKEDNSPIKHINLNEGSDVFSPIQLETNEKDKKDKKKYHGASYNPCQGRDEEFSPNKPYNPSEEINVPIFDIKLDSSNQSLSDPSINQKKIASQIASSDCTEEIFYEPPPYVEVECYSTSEPSIYQGQEIKIEMGTLSFRHSSFEDYSKCLNDSETLNFFRDNSILENDTMSKEIVYFMYYNRNDKLNISKSIIDQFLREFSQLTMTQFDPVHYNQILTCLETLYLKPLNCAKFNPLIEYLANSNLVSCIAQIFAFKFNLSNDESWEKVFLQYSQLIIHLVEYLSFKDNIKSHYTSIKILLPVIDLSIFIAPPNNQFYISLANFVINIFNPKFNSFNSKIIKSFKSSKIIESLLFHLYSSDNAESSVQVLNILIFIYKLDKKIRKVISEKAKSAVEQDLYFAGQLTAFLEKSISSVLDRNNIKSFVCNIINPVLQDSCSDSEEFTEDDGDYGGEVYDHEDLYVSEYGTENQDCFLEEADYDQYESEIYQDDHLYQNSETY
ncbi:hypothetical protein CYY_004977 [Polysphondylium violaceum]|uniref:Uncharacterized protein n=1 Tax=Polysphondylium violaceum TaxID=133409 RepID=A0A8J4PTR2_9MYCE|nr:hypothetical protein CYY_004977 [Polysphondylium violaceum]